MRYESIELSASSEAGQKDSDDSCQSMPAVDTGDNDIEMDETGADEENIDINIQQSKSHTRKGQKQAEDGSYDMIEKSNESVTQDEAEVTEITLTTDSDGRYVITTNQNLSEGESECIPMPENKEFEDSMYNLQMLGDVALKNQTEVDSII